MKSSNTARTGREQLLISNAVDQTLDKVNFTPFAGQRVFLDEARFDSVDKPYIISSIRHRLMHNGATMVAKAEEADVVLEPRSGGVGTDVVDTFLGIPEISMPGMPIAVPEVQLIKRQSQTAVAKIGFLAYSPESGQSIGQGGTSLAKSNDSNWFFMGMGPLQNGSVRSEVRRETRSRAPGATPLPTQVAFAAPPRRPSPTAPTTPDANPFEGSGRVRLTGDERPADASPAPPETREIRATGEFLPIPE